MPAQAYDFFGHIMRKNGVRICLFPKRYPCRRSSLKYNLGGTQRQRRYICRRCRCILEIRHCGQPARKGGAEALFACRVEQSCAEAEF